MATQKQWQAARQNVKKAQKGARQKKSITKLSSNTRSALGRGRANALRPASDDRATETFASACRGCPRGPAPASWVGAGGF